MDHDKGMRLVEREIYACVSSLVCAALQDGWNSDELIDSLSGKVDWEEAALQHLGGAPSGELIDIAEELEVDDDFDNSRDRQDAIMGKLRQDPDGFESFCRRYNVEPYEWEIYEYWIVSDWLARRLAEKGECVCHDWFNLTIWGRTSTGQRISMDHVIQEIARETYAD